MTRDDTAAGGFRWDSAVLARTEKELTRLPPSQAFIVTGCLDRIQHDDGRFRLCLKDGRSLAGQLDSGEVAVETLRPLWGRDATVTGMVHFRPDGSPRVMVAQHIMRREDTHEMFERLPQGELTGGPAILRDTGESARSFDWDSVRGSWPGDETIEELLDLLRELRSVR